MKMPTEPFENLKDLLRRTDIDEDLIYELSKYGIAIRLDKTENRINVFTWNKKIRGAIVTQYQQFENLYQYRRVVAEWGR